MTKKATVADLGNLLGLLTQELTQRIKGRMVEDEALGERMVYASSADLMAALALLKQNAITVDPETSAELLELQEALAARAAKRRKADVDALDALADELGNGT